MTFHQLQIFAAAAKHLSITKAAQALHTSQPSVSHQLKLLEEECGVKLYKKIGRGIAVTEQGRLFLGDAEPILDQIERLKKKFSNNLTVPKAGSLTVGGSYTPSTSFLPLLLASFKETHPHVDVILRTARSHSLEQQVLDCSVEIALITTASHCPSLIYEPYRPMKMVAFASVKHPLAAKRKLTVAELIQAPLIVKKKEAVPGRVSKIGEFLEEIEKRGLKPNIFMYCDSPQAVKAAVKTGIGVGLLYEMSLEAEIRAGELKILNVPEVKICMEASIIYHKDRALSPNTQDFLTLLREWPQKVKLLKGSLRAA